MTDRVNWSMGLSLVGGPSISLSDHFEAEAYDKVEETVLKNSVPLGVNVQPGGAGVVQAILIMSDNYDDLSFTVDEGQTPVVLDGPLMLVGAGLVTLLGATQKVFTFTNASTTTDANITILVARAAVEPEA